MPLRETLSDPAITNKSRPGLPCKIGTLLSDYGPMPEEDREYLARLMDSDPRSPDHKSVNSIVNALRKEGYDVNKTCVSNHRRKECRCFGTSPKA